MRLLGLGSDQILLARVKQDLALQIETARVGLLVIHMAIRLAEEKLPVDIQPSGGRRRQQRFCISARSADAVGGEQAGQVQRLAEDWRGEIAVVDRTGILKQALVALESRAPLFERDMQPRLFESDAGAIQIRGIAEGVGNRIVVAVSDKNRRAAPST